MNKALILGARMRTKANKVVELEEAIEELKNRSAIEAEKLDRAETEEEVSTVEKSLEELQKELKKEEEEKIAEIKAKIKDTGDLVAFMYDHCVACAEEYTDWTARRAVKEIAKNLLVVIAIITLA